MVQHRTTNDLNGALPHILASPKNNGTLEMIVARPEPGARQEQQSNRITLAGGVDGDHWAKGCWKSTDDGKPHPDVQICIMNSRCIDFIAGNRSRWSLAGDNFFVDLDLSAKNLPVGQRLVIGRAEIEITDTPHNGCQAFIDHFGREACVFVNTGAGKSDHLRGVYARVTRDGTVKRGDRIRKFP